MRLRRCRSSRPRFVGLSESSTQLKQRRRRVTALWALPCERKRQWGWCQRKEGGAFAPPSIRLICKGYRGQLNHAVLVAPPFLPFSAWPSRASLALTRHSLRATWPSRNPSCPRKPRCVYGLRAQLLGCGRPRSPVRRCSRPSASSDTTRFTFGLFTDCTAKMESFANMGHHLAEHAPQRQRVGAVLDPAALVPQACRPRWGPEAGPGRSTRSAWAGSCRCSRSSTCRRQMMNTQVMSGHSMSCFFLDDVDAPPAGHARRCSGCRQCR